MQNACLVGLCYKHVSGAYITYACEPFSQADLV